jgi:hypothetical protein
MQKIAFYVALPDSFYVLLPKQTVIELHQASEDFTNGPSSFAAPWLTACLIVTDISVHRCLLGL